MNTPIICYQLQFFCWYKADFYVIINASRCSAVVPTCTRRWEMYLLALEKIQQKHAKKTVFVRVCFNYIFALTTYFSLQNFKSCFGLKIVPYIPSASRIKTLMRKIYFRIEWLFLPKNKTLKINQNRRDFIYEIFLGLRITRRFSLLALPVKFCNIVQPPPPFFLKAGRGRGRGE